VNAILDICSVVWEKSSYSNGSGGECLEFSRTFAPSGLIRVRDSKDPSGPSLIFSAPEWSEFVKSVKNGEFIA
jgi:hypothetical protein